MRLIEIFERLVLSDIAFTLLTLRKICGKFNYQDLNYQVMLKVKLITVTITIVKTTKNCVKTTQTLNYQF